MERQYALLIVDADTQERAAYEKFFAENGFEVEVTSSGEAGLEKLRQHEFDVVITEISLPGDMDGIEMIKRAKAEDIDTDFVILTGHGDKDDAVKAINIGIVKAWFEKSNIDMEQFKERVIEVAQVIPLDTIRRLLAVTPGKA